MSIQQTIMNKLTAEFQPTFLSVDNESHLHHSGKGVESHFKVTIVSPHFESLRTVARHQAVYACLAYELESGVHALALHTYTQSEWQAQGETIPQSTNCLGYGH